MLGSRRVLYVIGALMAGGAERLVVDLALALKRLGVEVELACLLDSRDAAGRSWESSLVGLGIPVHFGPRPHLGVSSVVWLRQLLARQDFDIVHIHLYYVELAYYAARLLHRRDYSVLRTIHNTQPPSTPLARWAMRHSDIRFSIACGEACHEAHRGRVEGELVCVPNGIAFDWPRHDPAQREARLDRLGLDPDLTHYVCVGRMFGPSSARSQKAQDDLVGAWRRAGLAERGARLHLLGDGPLRGELERLAAGDPSIVFHGIVSNVREFLSACDTAVMPSRWEGLPIAGIEAVGTGIGCVFSDIEPFRELADGFADFVPVADQEELARRLIIRFKCREGIDAEVVTRFCERFGIDGVAREHVRIYQQLLGEESGAGDREPSAT